MAQFLIDTHVLIWYLEDDSQLSANVAEILEDTRHNLYVSIVSLWEIAIKSGLGKLKLKIEFHDLKEVLKRLSIEILSIDFEDTQTYLTLPLFENHRDPFDRILVAQVMRRSIALVSGDKKFDLYEIHRVWR
ncbi:MAG: type II toxin-antitoxin system VapC family toxin [Alkalinema sp. CAN_BIN05]|nr:type II toxin-antitoxin system VapC family toxin [Alkalinema sp. CAN_BIN05]